MCLVVLSLLVVSAALSSLVNKPFQCPLLTTLPPSEVLRLNLYCQSSLFATNTTAFVGFVLPNLRVKHKTYHCIDCQSIYSTPPESSSLDMPNKHSTSFLHVPLEILLMSSGSSANFTYLRYLPRQP